MRNGFGTGSLTLLVGADSTSFLVPASELRWWAIVRFVLIGTIFYLITTLHLVKIWKRYNAKKAMSIHTAAALLETVKFSVEDVFRDPVPGRLDLLIATVHNISSLAVTVPVLKGNKDWTRPMFQASVFVRILLGIYAHATGSLGAHRTAVYLNHAGIYIRIGIGIFRRTSMPYSKVYTTVVFVSGAIAYETGSYESGLLPFGVLSVALGLAAVAIKYLRDFNVDLDLPDVADPRAASQSPVSVPAEYVQKSKAPELADQVGINEARPIALDPITTDWRDLIASPASPRHLTFSALQELDATFSGTMGRHRAPYNREGSPSCSSVLSEESTPLRTPQSEALTFATSVSGLNVPQQEEDQLHQQRQDKPKLKGSLAPLDTSSPTLSKSLAGPLTGPWRVLMQSPVAAQLLPPLSAADPAATMRRELRILAVRAGLSPLKEWHAVRKWDRERSAAKAQ